MKKKLLFAFLVVVMIFALTLGVLSANSDLSIVIDNKEVEFTSDSGEPFIDENGRTQVPLRVVVEQYGCDVEWDGANNCAIITKGSTTVIVPIGKSHILVDGEKVAIDTAAIIKDGRTYLPIRAVLESFGAELEWNNGVVSVKSPATNDFENIYVDEDGNLIFELSNGNKLNVGNIAAADGKDGKNGKDGKDGADGKDGVSVVNAYIDSSSNLMIVLSNGNTINAGNVGTGGNMSGLTFADYPVGTKFYLAYPTGEFDVKVSVDGTPYTVHFDSIYYELTAKYAFDDEEAWVYSDSSSKYVPFKIAMHIEGNADEALAGKTIRITFYSVDGEAVWGYAKKISADGSFSLEFIQGGTYTAWYKPKELYFQDVTITNSSISPDDQDKVEKDKAEAIKKIAGTYVIPGNDDKSFVVSEDGTITYGGVDYSMNYQLVNSSSNNACLIARCDDYTAETDLKEILFLLENFRAYVYWNGGEWLYYKKGSDDEIAIFDAIKNAAGTYVIPGNTEELLVFCENGVITYNGIDYYPEYTSIDNGDTSRLRVDFISNAGVFVDCIDFYLSGSESYIAHVHKVSAEHFELYREDAFETVTLTKDNFLNYFEYEDNFDVRCDAWGVLEGVDYESNYVLKKELGSRLLTASGVAIKYQNDIYTASYSVDLENKKCTVVVGEYIETKSEVIKANATYWPDNIYINYVNHILGLDPNATTYKKPVIVDAIGTLYLLKG